MARLARRDQHVTTACRLPDTHRLVEAVSGDDHSGDNVPVLVREVATRAQTNRNSAGTDLDDLMRGLAGYVNSKGLAQDYTLTLRHSPSFDWVREEIRQQRPAILLLGFWELQPTGWRRLGGHYVAVAGAGSGDEEWIAFSDPLRDAAEVGLAGRVLPVAGHTHPADPPDATHNNAANVSHDIYGILRTAQGYAPTYGSIDNFAGLNFSPALEAARAGAYLGGEIITLVDDAIVLAPSSPSVLLRLSPAINRVLTGEVFQVEIDLHAGRQPVDTVHAYMAFDPDKLQVVDANGDPAGQITPGLVLTTVLTNTVNNATGEISFAAQGPAHDGRFVAAIVSFRAISTALASPITFIVTGTPTADVLHEGNSVLAHATGAVANILPGARIVAHADMQRATPAPHVSWQVPVLLTLSRPGERGPAYAFAAVASPTGTFAIPSVVTPDTYRVRLEGLHTLRNLLLSRTLTPGLNHIDMSTLLEGDALNDNRVNLHDVSLLARAWGKSQEQTGFDPRADFNEDDIVDISDLDLLRPNLGRRGDVLVGIGPSAYSGLPEIVLAPQTLATGSVTVGLIPSATQSIVGQIITLDVVARSGSQQVDTVDIALDYDPEAMTVVDAGGQVTTTIIAGAALPLVLRNQVDLGRGYVDYTATSLGGQPVSGDVVIARLRLKLLRAGSHTVRFGVSGWRETAVSHAGQSVLGNLEAAEVRVTAGHLLHLPVILRP